MSTHTPSPCIVETIITADSLLKKDVSTHASHDKDAPAVSKQAMKAYRRAKKASEAQNIRSRRICAEMRSKREGSDLHVVPMIREETALKVQMLLSDF